MTREEMLNELSARADRGKALKEECLASQNLEDPCWVALRVNAQRCDWLRRKLYGEKLSLPPAGAA